MTDGFQPEPPVANRFFLEYPEDWDDLIDDQKMAVAYGMAEEIRRRLGIVVEGEAHGATGASPSEARND